ncbi:MAG: AIR synthase family protein [Candidatus Methylomirabilales bacterium]
MGNRLLAGKLPTDLLAALLARYASPSTGVVLGPRIGEDAAVLAMADRYLVVSTDPITYATAEMGTYAVTVNANDVVTRGARPRWFLMTLLLPEGKGEAEVEALFRQVDAACRRIHVGLVGGHTEVTPGLDRPLLVGTMIGEVATDRLVVTSGAHVGDDLLLTKGIAVEGTVILAREREAWLTSRGYSNAFIQRAQGYLADPGIGVATEALMAVETARVSAMHDPTEGGLSGGLYELSGAAGVGLEVEGPQIPIFEETRRLCQEFGLDPLGLIASGALLITCRPGDTARLLGAIEGVGVAVRRIGRVVPHTRGVVLTDPGGERPFPAFSRDEIVKIFAG